MLNQLSANTQHRLRIASTGRLWFVSPPEIDLKSRGTSAHKSVSDTHGRFGSEHSCVARVHGFDDSLPLQIRISRKIKTLSSPNTLLSDSKMRNWTFSSSSSLEVPLAVRYQSHDTLWGMLTIGPSSLADWPAPWPTFFLNGFCVEKGMSAFFISSLSAPKDFRNTGRELGTVGVPLNPTSW
jgi:hypothetical protein